MVRWQVGVVNYYYYYYYYYLFLSMSLYLGGEIFDIYKQPLQGEFIHLFVRRGKDLYRCTCTCTVHVQYIMDICYKKCLRIKIPFVTGMKMTGQND